MSTSWGVCARMTENKESKGVFIWLATSGKKGLESMGLLEKE